MSLEVKDLCDNDRYITFVIDSEEFKISKKMAKISNYLSVLFEDDIDKIEINYKNVELDNFRIIYKYLELL